jgi:hypothetical protein
MRNMIIAPNGEDLGGRLHLAASVGQTQIIDVSQRNKSRPIFVRAAIAPGDKADIVVESRSIRFDSGIVGIMM